MSELLKDLPKNPDPEPVGARTPRSGATPSAMRPDSRRVSTARLVLAFVVAVVADLVTGFLGAPPFMGIPGLLIDIPTVLILLALLGFSPLLFITLICELIPGLQMAPWWTALVAVIALAPEILGNPKRKVLKFLLGRFK